MNKLFKSANKEYSHNNKNKPNERYNWSKGFWFKICIIILLITNSSN